MKYYFVFYLTRVDEIVHEIYMLEISLRVINNMFLYYFMKIGFNFAPQVLEVLSVSRI